jgi:hypothetical protein
MHKTIHCSESHSGILEDVSPFSEGLGARATHPPGHRAFTITESKPCDAACRNDVQLLRLGQQKTGRHRVRQHFAVDNATEQNEGSRSDGQQATPCYWTYAFHGRPNAATKPELFVIALWLLPAHSVWEFLRRSSWCLSVCSVSRPDLQSMGTSIASASAISFAFSCGLIFFPACASASFSNATWRPVSPESVADDPIEVSFVHGADVPNGHGLTADRRYRT